MLAKDSSSYSYKRLDQIVNEVYRLDYVCFSLSHLNGDKEREYLKLKGFILEDKTFYIESWHRDNSYRFQPSYMTSYGPEDV